jgi:MFS family permease
MTNASYRWVIVAAGAVIGCMAAGSMFSLPVFLKPISDDTGWSITGISTAMTLGFLAMALASMAWGNLSDRIGTRPVVLIGATILASSLAWASRATSLVEFQFVFGVLVGGSIAAIFAPIMACVTGWFETQRSLAVSLVSAGIGVAPMTVAPTAAWLATQYDWRTCMLIIAGVAAAIMIPAALLVRSPPKVTSSELSAPDASQSTLTVTDAVRSPQFIILLLTNFFCCATHSGPIFHTVGYAVSCGIPLVAAVTIYSVEGLSGLFGRIGFGFLGDRFGAKQVLVAGLLVQAFGALGYAFVRDLNAFYAVAMLFGFVYAGTMPLYAVLIRENFPMHMMGTIIGGISMAGSLGMATGPLAGGLIYDQFASYTWLYVGSFAFGIGAFLIAMMFKPFPKPRAALSMA